VRAGEQEAFSSVAHNSRLRIAVTYGAALSQPFAARHALVKNVVERRSIRGGCPTRDPPLDAGVESFSVSHRETFHGVESLPVSHRETFHGVESLRVNHRETFHGIESLPVNHRETFHRVGSLRVSHRETFHGVESLPVSHRETFHGVESLPVSHRESFHGAYLLPARRRESFDGVESLPVCSAESSMCRPAETQPARTAAHGSAAKLRTIGWPISYAGAPPAAGRVSVLAEEVLDARLEGDGDLVERRDRRARLGALDLREQRHRETGAT
jgi:hypothetical protein